MSHTPDLMRIFDVKRAKESILRRVAWDELDIPDPILDRLESIFGERLSPEEGVKRILADVRNQGDAAVIDYTRRIDNIKLHSLVVTEEQIHAAYTQVDDSVINAIKLSAERIEAFHHRQPALSWIHNDEEGTLGQLVRPIERVGIYIPGGSAPLFSSLLMTAIPAKVAGVPHISVISPPQPDSGLPFSATLVAADVVGVERVYIAGGAQAIGAMTFGTESIHKVDKICGPGNLFTTLAKRQVFGLVGIDGLPGPTETVVIADDETDPELAAADLLAQAEHDLLACAILLTPNREMAEKVQVSVMQQIEELGRADTVAASLSRGSGIVVTESLQEAIILANEYAPEHLCLLMQDPWRYLSDVQNAGGIFFGEQSFEVLGDYVAGPSHVMPTGGTARFASPINVHDFVKIISLISLNEAAMAQIAPVAETLALAEGLTGHAAAANKRM